jgi:hypothetical protein
MQYAECQISATRERCFSFLVQRPRSNAILRVSDQCDKGAMLLISGPETKKQCNTPSARSMRQGSDASHFWSSDQDSMQSAECQISVRQGSDTSHFWSPIMHLAILITCQVPDQCDTWEQCFAIPKCSVRKKSSVRVEAFEACGESEILVFFSHDQNNNYCSSFM